MATGSNDIDEIYHRMAVIRRELHTNVRESVAGAEAFADWGRYTWTYPWIALGAAAAVGYVVYTSGHQRVTRTPRAWPMGPRLVNQSREPGAGVRKVEDRPEAPARRLGHRFPRGRPCGPELPAALARTTIPDEDSGPDRTLVVGRGAGRLDGPSGAVGH